MFGYPLMVKVKDWHMTVVGMLLLTIKRSYPLSFLDLPVIVARSRDGCTVCYHVVETIHKKI